MVRGAERFCRISVIVATPPSRARLEVQIRFSAGQMVRKSKPARHDRTSRVDSLREVETGGMSTTTPMR
jgi:hypothetical protein